MPYPVTMYMCGLCLSRHLTEEAAEACEAYHRKPVKTQPVIGRGSAFETRGYPKRVRIKFDNGVVLEYSAPRDEIIFNEDDDAKREVATSERKASTEKGCPAKR